MAMSEVQKLMAQRAEARADSAPSAASRAPLPTFSGLSRTTQSTAAPAVSTPVKTSAPSMEEMNQFYLDTFGRPIDAEGAQYWSQDFAKNGADGWQDTIKRGAYGTGHSAMMDMAREGTTSDQTWTGEYGVNDQGLKYDATLNKWVVDPHPMQTSLNPPKRNEPRNMRDGLDYVDPEKSTVAGQLNSLLSNESKYIQEARRQGSLLSAQRGGTNSTANASASERAAIAAAAPIASQDAATYAAAQGRQQTGDINAELSSQDAFQIAQENYRGFGYDTNLAYQQIDGNLRAIDKQGTIQSALDAQAQENSRLLQQMGLDADASNLYTKIMGDITVNTMNNLAGALANTSISNKEGVLEILTGLVGDSKLFGDAFKISI